MSNQKNEKINSEMRLSIRLEHEYAEKLTSIMEARGLDKSQAVRFCIKRSIILQFGDIKQLGQEFYKTRIALENNKFDEDVRKVVDKLCQSIKDVLLQTEILEG